MSQRKTFSLLTGEPALSKSAPASHPSEAHPDVRTFISQFATVVCNDGPHWDREADRDQKARDALAQLLNRHSDPVMVSEKMSSALADLEIARAKAVRREQINPAIYRGLVARRVQIAVLSYLAPDEPEAAYSDTSAIEEALQALEVLQGSPVMKLLTDHATSHSRSTYLTAVMRDENGSPLPEDQSEAAARIYASNPAAHLQRFVRQVKIDAGALASAKKAGAIRVRSGDEHQARLIFSRMVAAYEAGNTSILSETDEHLFALEKFVAALFGLPNKGNRISEEIWRRAAGRYT